MKQLISNITSLYGDQGQKWLNELDSLKSALTKHWNLTQIRPVENMTYHFVAKALKDQCIPVVLKIGYDSKGMNNEARALEHFNGFGAIKLLDKKMQSCALLLEQAIDGSSLLHHIDDIKIYASVLKKLCSKPKSPDFTHVRVWLESLDKCMSDKIEPNLLSKAIKMKNRLLDEVKSEHLLHSDLHLDNIVKHADQWLAIDPKGLIGPIEFEAAAFDFVDMKKEINPAILHKRIELLAIQLNIDSHTFKEYVFVRLMLGAVFSVEDNTDASQYLTTAKSLLI